MEPDDRNQNLVAGLRKLDYTRSYDSNFLLGAFFRLYFYQLSQNYLGEVLTGSPRHRALGCGKSKTEESIGHL